MGGMIRHQQLLLVNVNYNLDSALNPMRSYSPHGVEHVLLRKMTVQHHDKASRRNEVLFTAVRRDTME